MVTVESNRPGDSSSNTRRNYFPTLNPRMKKFFLQGMVYVQFMKIMGMGEKPRKKK